MLELFFLLPIFNFLIATASLALLFFTLFFAYDLYFYQGKWLGPKIKNFLWPLIIFVSSVGVVISLIYSEIFLFVPCSLCWLQRVALYPIALLAVLAFTVKDSTYFPRYAVGLSVFGLIVSLYQYVYQMLPAETRDNLAPCLVDGSANCADKIIDMFGFVTFPFISAVSFAFLITLLQYLKKTK